MRTTYNPKKIPRVIIIQKLYGKFFNDDSELKFSKINPITPKDYVDNIWIRDRSGMKKLKPNEVFEHIVNNL